MMCLDVGKVYNKLSNQQKIHSNYCRYYCRSTYISVLYCHCSWRTSCVIVGEVLAKDFNYKTCSIKLMILLYSVTHQQQPIQPFPWWCCLRVNSSYNSNVFCLVFLFVILDVVEFSFVVFFSNFLLLRPIS